MFFFFFNKMFRKTSEAVWCAKYMRRESFLDTIFCVTHFIDSSSRLSHKINKYTVNSHFVRFNDIVLV